MALVFITGSKGKFDEAKHFLPGLVQLELDLPERQSLSSEEIITAKLHEARKHHAGPLMVDDTSLELEGLNGFPGPLIKWLFGSLGPDGLYKLCKDIGNANARAVCTIGYSHGTAIEFFTGTMNGTIVQPRPGRVFGWDTVFLPVGETRTYNQIPIEEKNQTSHRGKALAQLAGYLRK